MIQSSTDNHVSFAGKPFFEQFNGYYEQWKDRHALSRFHQVGTSEFATAINKTLVGLRIEEEEMNASAADDIRVHKRIPSPDQLKAIAIVFGLYGAERDDFTRQAAIALQTRQEAAAEQHRQKLLPLRRTNPDGNTALPSFAEMLEESYHAKMTTTPSENINTLLWDRVFRQWGHDGRNLSPQQFCQLIDANNSDKDGKSSLTNHVVYNWRNHPDKDRPNSQSITTICKAFALTPYPPKPFDAADYKHEIMLWKVANGRNFKNPYPGENLAGDGIAHTPNNLDAAIFAAQATGSHGPLVHALVEASGIPNARLENLLESQQLIPWYHGAHIGDKETAQRFLDLVHPADLQPNPAHARKQNQLLLGLITGRDFDLPTLMHHAQEKSVENPGGKLLMLLTGRKGMVTISAEDLSDELTKRGHDVSEDKVLKLRSSVHTRGGYITEPIARSLMDIVQEKSGIALPYEQTEACVDILTNCPPAQKLLAQCVAGTLSIGEMLRKTYERKGLSQQECEKSIGISNLSDLVMGKSKATHSTANKIATWLELDDGQRRQFVLLATNRKAGLDPEAVLDDVMNGKQARTDGLRLIFDASGMTRTELGKAAGMDLLSSQKESSGGRIVAPEETIRKIAQLCGLEGREDDFVHTFSAQWVSRTRAKTPQTEQQSTPSIAIR